MYMKYNNFLKKISKIVLLVLAITFTSCVDFLETKQFTTSNEVGFYKTAKDFDQAVLGAYSAFGGLYNSGTFYFLMTDVRSDNTSVYVPGGAFGPLSKSEYDDFTLTSNNEHLGGYWNTAYVLIQRSNDIINFIAGASVAQPLKDQYTGEAKVLRAIAYFNLVRFWGEVPLVTSRFAKIEDSYEKGRNTIAEVYAQIETDLKDAATLLVTKRQTGSNVGRVDLGIALSLLGEVYLTQKKYTEAAAEYKKVIDLGVYGLVPVYSNLFGDGKQGNIETIWQAQFVANSNVESAYPSYCAPVGSEEVLVSILAFGWNQPTDDIADAYGVGDVRRNAIGNGYTKNSVYFPNKYIKSYVDGVGAVSSGKDWYVLRYADVLLKYAEAVNEVSGPASAYASVNLVRTRAGLANLPAGLSKDSFRDAVYQEERLESPFEGHRWFDLARTGRTLAVMNAKVKATLTALGTIGISAPINANQILLPIPSIVIANAPKVTQNPGY